MAAGDGLLVRVRPPLGRMTTAQAVALAAAAQTHGNGAIDLTNRGGLQLRGVSEATWPVLLEALGGAGLLRPADEADLPVMVAPDWREGEDTHRIATGLDARLREFPTLPAKVGIAVDAGEAAMLCDGPADFRIERATTGTLMLRAEGHPTGAAVRAGEEVDALLALARWFVEAGGAAAGRMVRLTAPLPGFATGDLRPRGSAMPRPGAHPLGAMIGMAFGRIEARELAALVDAGASALRVTPWRMLIAEGLSPDAVVTNPALLAVDACVGAPACPQASVETRRFAARLAPHVAGLHVSGCAKGCARARPAAVTLTGRDGCFDLAFDARAGDPPRFAGLSPEDVLARFGAA
jgi:precorrin-3B synthase